MELADIEAAEDALAVAEDLWDDWDQPRRRQFLATMADLLGHEQFLRVTFTHVRVMRAQLDELPYEAVAGSPDPDGTLLDFLRSTYEAAATLGRWDREALESRR